MPICMLLLVRLALLAQTIVAFTTLAHCPIHIYTDEKRLLRQRSMNRYCLLTAKRSTRKADHMLSPLLRWHFNNMFVSTTIIHARITVIQPNRVALRVSTATVPTVATRSSSRCCQVFLLRAVRVRDNFACMKKVSEDHFSFPIPWLTLVLFAVFRLHDALVGISSFPTLRFSRVQKRPSALVGDYRLPIHVTKWSLRSGWVNTSICKWNEAWRRAQNSTVSTCSFLSQSSN